MIILDVVDKQRKGRNFIGGRREVLLQMLRMRFDQKDSPHSQNVVQDLRQPLPHDRNPRTILSIRSRIGHVWKGDIGAPGMRVINGVKKGEELDKVVINWRRLGVK